MLGNPWLRLRGLFGTETRQVGSVQSVNADGTSTVQLVGGGVVVVTGTGFAVSSAVFVEGGAIVGGAPSLTVSTIEV